MSAQERDELMELCWKAIGGRSLHVAPQSAKDDMAATADALLAAGWSRPVAAGGEVEAADLLAGVVPGRSEGEIKAAVDRAARAFYIASDDDPEWAARAWDDMGGSEPSAERARIEMAMEVALAAAERSDHR